ncbi:MAG: ABC exporter membrane fusion protein [Xenococcaceae cyanobacterium MO_188.B32]|nr:ABC exporter membrane fusion protein [Xenococcaceae cyanobacterium MO_188.B32]
MKYQLLVKPKERFAIASIITATLVAGGFLAYYFAGTRGDRSASEPATETQVLPQAVAAIGYLEPQGEVIKVSASAFREGTKVEQLLVKRGEHITKGQTIAILDDRPRLQATLEQAQKQVIANKARLAQVKAGAKKGDIEAQNAKFQEVRAELVGQINSQTASIANLKAQLQGQTNSQQANIDRLKAELVNATRECQRYEFLLADGAIATSERDRVCLLQETTQKQLKAAEVNLIEIKETLAQQISEAEANLERTKTTLTRQISQAEASFQAIAEVRAVDVSVAQAELEVAEAAVKKARADLELAYVKSPIEGQILEINTWPGEVVNKTEGIVEVGNTKHMYVVAEVYETEIDRIRIGQKATITSGGIMPKLTGTVDDVGWQIRTQDVLDTDPVADVDARVVEVKIRLHPEDSRKVANLTNLQVNVLIETANQNQSRD